MAPIHDRQGGRSLGMNKGSIGFLSTIQTYDSINQCMCRLKELHENGDTSLKLFEQGFGFIYSPLNIISNTKYDIGIATATMFDWCHVYCSSGLADAEFGEFMQKMKRLKGEGITGCRYVFF